MAGQEGDQTRVGSIIQPTSASPDRRVHYLQVLSGLNIGQRYVIGQTGAKIGRAPPADIVIPDSEVSRAHCQISLFGEDFVVEDLGSTNGTIVDGVRIAAASRAPLGAIIQIGRQTFKHDSRAALDMAQRQELDRDLEKANAYVQALLPAPAREGPVRSDWVYLPSSKLGGDAFGYRALNESVFVGYLIDVSGHGAGAAMHTVSVLNVLARGALPDTDLLDPAQVLSALNVMFPMDSCAGMYFTIWYGVYDTRTRRLTYASGGHHPAFLIAPSRREATPLATRAPLIGAIDGAAYKSASVQVEPGSSLYVFSDGVFEITTAAGEQWSLNHFTPLLLASPIPGVSEPQRLFEAVQGLAQPGGFDDDFSMVVLTFD